MITVNRNAVMLDSTCVSDRRSIMSSYSDITDDAQTVYKFATETLEAEISELANTAANGITAAQEAYANVAATVAGQTGFSVGDIKETAGTPTPANEWLQCNGAAISSEYSALIAVVGSTLPNIAADNSKFTAYIYAGRPDS